MSSFESKLIARVLSLAIAGATVLACGQLTGIDDAPIIKEGSTEPTTPGGPPVVSDNRPDKEIVIEPAELDFGTAACGSELAGKELIRIQNLAKTATTYKVIVPENAPFRIGGPLEAPIAAGSVVTLSVFAKPMASNDTATGIVVTAGKAVQNVTAKVRGGGGSLTFVPALVNFGDVRMQNGGGPFDVEIVNSGNAPVYISSFDGLSEFAIVGGAFPIQVPPDGSKVVVKASLKGGGESSALQETAKLGLAETLCGTKPELLLKGRRINANITVSSSADWGKVGCKAMPGTKEVTITNYSTSQVMYNAALPGTSAFEVVSGGGTALVVAPGSSTAPKTAKIVIRPKPYATTLGAIAEALPVEITTPPDAASGGGPRPAPLAIDWRGAVVVLTPAALSFSSDGSATDTKNFSAKNTGNERIALNWRIDYVSGGTGWSASTFGSLTPGQSRTGSVGFKANATGTSTARLVPSFTYDFFFGSAQECAPMGVVDLTGTTP